MKEGRSYVSDGRSHLLDFKVRVLDGHDGTGATVRVLIESGDDDDSWSTVGSSENLIEASWIALSDSLEFAINRRRNA